MNRQQTQKTRRLQKNLFIAAIFAVPVFNFLLLNIGSLFNMVTLAFQGYNIEKGYYWNNFANFKDIMTDLMNPLLWTGFKNSVLFYVIGLVMLLVSLVISYYIFKGHPGSNFFKILFIMPGIVTGMVWVTLFKYFVQRAVPVLFGLDYGWLTTLETTMPTLIGFGVWLGFAGNLIIFVGTMSGISDELVEAGQLDGTNAFTEFYHIVIPHTFPIVQVNLVAGVIGLFLSGPPLYDFFGLTAHESLYSIDYFLKVKVLQGGSGPAQYAYTAAFSILLTLIVAPGTFFMRWATTKFGPSED